MELTPENKATIDDKSYLDLLRHARCAPAGDKWFEGATGTYWVERMRNLKAQPGGDAEHVAASKAIGWN